MGIGRAPERPGIGRTAPTAEKKEEGPQPLVGKAKGKRYEGEDKELGWRKEAWNSPAPKSSRV